MRDKAVLLVDDDAPVLESLSNYLVQKKYFVQTAKSAEEALVQFHSTFFDLVITDLVMDGASGMSLLQRLKKVNSTICVFILTGQGDLPLAIEALRCGADDFLLKPCDVEELMLRMERAFERQEALKKIRIYEKFLPICMYCNRIRDDTGTEWGSGKWLRLEDFLRRTSGVDLTHGCCPECFEKHKDDWFES